MANYAKRVFDYAIDEQLITSNPMERVKVPKNRNVKREVAYYEKEELLEFLDSAKKEQNPIWYPLFYLLAFTGMRKGEALALQWKDIDFMNQHLTVSKTLTRGKNSRLYVEDSPKTQAGNRDIPLDPSVLSILKQWRKDQREMYIKLGHNTLNDSQLLFTNLNNDFMQPPALTKAMDRIVKKNNLKRITVHQLRHTHASLLFNAGASIKEVQQRLGHSSYEVTMNVYTHVTKDKQEETVDKFAHYMNL
ncbi:MAG: site-specific integrase [Alkalibacterium sp.]|nr:site-specific integrase [Alkalibacterium sp.]